MDPPPRLIWLQNKISNKMYENSVFQEHKIKRFSTTTKKVDESRIKRQNIHSSVTCLTNTSQLGGMLVECCLLFSQFSVFLAFHIFH